MHAVSTNQIADILYFNDKNIEKLLKSNWFSYWLRFNKKNILVTTYLCQMTLKILYLYLCIIVQHQNIKLLTLKAICSNICSNFMSCTLVLVPTSAAHNFENNVLLLHLRITAISTKEHGDIYHIFLIKRCIHNI